MKSGSRPAAIGSTRPEKTSVITNRVIPPDNGVSRYVRTPRNITALPWLQTISRGGVNVVTSISKTVPGASGTSILTDPPGPMVPAMLASVEFHRTMSSASVSSCQIRSGVAAISAVTAHSRRNIDLDAVATIAGWSVTRSSYRYDPSVNQLPPERMIPLLPCRSMDEQLAFYESIGFEVTYRQKAPNVYASVQRGLIELHFFTMKGYEPAASYSTCYALVADIDRLYADFRDGLKRSLGRVPTRGIPRIGALGDMSYGVRQFLLTDPGGNIIRIGQPLARTDAAPPTSRLAKALEAATLLMHSKGDPETTARVLDAAMADDPDAPDVLLVQARILRAEAAHALGDDALAADLLGLVAQPELNADDRARIADDLARADELRSALD